METVFCALRCLRLAVTLRWTLPSRWYFRFIFSEFPFIVQIMLLKCLLFCEKQNNFIIMWSKVLYWMSCLPPLLTYSLPFSYNTEIRLGLRKCSADNQQLTVLLQGHLWKGPLLLLLAVYCLSPNSCVLHTGEKILNNIRPFMVLYQFEIWVHCNQ